MEKERGSKERDNERKGGRERMRGRGGYRGRQRGGIKRERGAKRLRL
jgi:hypothetical protein